jgi:hypothetical protein
MENILTRLWEDFISRPSGPFGFRFFIQPLVATTFAVRAGIIDARSGNPAFLFDYWTHPARRSELARDAWKDTAKLFTFGVILDVLFQLMVFRWVYPGEALLIAFTLTVLPYVLIRGPVTRLYSHVPRGKPFRHGYTPRSFD